MSQELWLLNPRRRRSRSRVEKSRIHRRARRTRRKRPTIMETRHVREIRRRRHNPPPARDVFGSLGHATVGFLGTRLVGNMLIPVTGGLITPVGMETQPGLTQPIFRMIIKGGIAYLIAWAGENMMGRRAFEPVFLGGAVEVIHDFVRTFFAPVAPVLAGDTPPLGALPYPYTEIGSYPYPLLGTEPDLLEGDEPDLLEGDEPDLLEGDEPDLLEGADEEADIVF